jgi:hypothetical protein
MFFCLLLIGKVKKFFQLIFYFYYYFFNILCIRLLSRIKILKKFSSNFIYWAFVLFKCFNKIFFTANKSLKLFWKKLIYKYYGISITDYQYGSNLKLDLPLILHHFYVIKFNNFFKYWSHNFIKITITWIELLRILIVNLNKWSLIF